MCPSLSSAKPPVTGKYGFLLFSRLVPSPNMCICVYYVIGVFLLFVFVLFDVGFMFFSVITHSNVFV